MGNFIAMLCRVNRCYWLLLLLIETLYHIHIALTEDFDITSTLVVN